MKHTFSRIYITIIVSLIIAQSIAFLIALFVLTHPADDTIKELAKAKLLSAGESIQQTGIEALPNQMSSFPLKVIPWYSRAFTDTEFNTLKKRQAVIQSDTLRQSMVGFYALSETGPLLMLGPIPTNHHYRFLFISTGLLTLLICGLMLYIFSTPIERRLQHLKASADKLAHGELSVRTSVNREDTIGGLEKSFNYMADRIQSLVRAQQELTNAVSHELRTPIARIRFALEMIEQATTLEEQQTLLAGMDEDLSDLDGLIDELLTYAKLGAGRPELALVEVDIKKCVFDVCNRLQDIHTDIDYEINIDNRDNEGIVAEPLYLQRAIHNLVSNASRYGNTKVSIHFETRENAHFIIVDDDGPGIPLEERQRIFSPFTRLDNSRTRQTGGYGLGLAIVRRIVRWHKGKIWVDESPDGGSRFMFCWPRNLKTTDA